MFKAVNSKVNFPQMEREILAFWKENHIFEKSVEQRKGGPLYVLYDGPPTANASPGIHHVLARVFKDIFPRYKAMRGYYTPRRAGWDTHGLPVEIEVEKELGLTNKNEIEQYGIAEFNQRCRQNVLKYVKEWEGLTDRIAFWIDMTNPYITFDNGYIETCWWIIKQLWDQGLVYQGYRVTPHCPRCGTSLSSHEVALGYKDDTVDPSIYIKFRLLPLNSKRKALQGFQSRFAVKPAYMLAWTTTPWTLPGNTALAVAPDAEYSVMEGDNEHLILATALVGRTDLKGYSEQGRVKGSDLEGIQYEPLFNPHKFGIERKRFIQLVGDGGERRMELESQPKEEDLAYSVITADFVSMEDGTGVVHIAPSFGEDDYEAGEEKGLSFVRDYVDLQGNVQGTYPFAGRFVKDADPLILDDLRSRNLVYRQETITHTYPFCWRCSTPLLYYAKPSWYIRTTAKKERLLSGNEEINWYPDHIKHGRFGDWLNNNVDWAFSRERYWGTPVPIWRCAGCGYEECIGGFDGLKNKAGITGTDALTDLHRPYIDAVTFNCSRCGKRMTRVAEVIDCWFDSGAMPVAQWHFPFENNTLLKDGRFPADYICEAIDQTRGWFYSLHAISVLLFEQPCYRNVICLGHILDAAGEKMSKSKGNVVTPYEVLDATGADALRWYMYTSSPPGNVRRFSKELVEEVLRKFFLTLWNTYSFFVTYANIDEFNPLNSSSVSITAELDRWIISELNQLIAKLTEDFEQYDPTSAGRRIEDFVDNLSNWYVRRSRKRFWKSENDDDKYAAYTTLYQCLVTLTKLIAPLAPYIAEEMYQNLVRSVNSAANESVHLADYPVADKSLIDENLSNDTRLVMLVSSMGRSARAKANIKVRQPLQSVLITLSSRKDKEALERNSDQIRDELNVKEVVCKRGDIAFTIEPNRKQLRKKYGKDADRIAREVENFSSEELAMVAEKLNRREEVKIAGQVLADQDITLLTNTPGYTGVVSHGIAVEIATEITQDLADEGLARELVHRLQFMRRSAGFDIADHIEIYYQGDEAVRRIMNSFSSYIKQETLSRSIVEGSIPEDSFTEKQKIDSKEISLGVKRILC